MGFKRMTLKYPQDCTICGKRIHRGEPATLRRRSLNGRAISEYICDDCDLVSVKEG